MQLIENFKSPFNKNSFIYFKKIFNIELIFWTAALLYLGISNFGDTVHFSFCPFHNLGINFCPGCGIGRSISYTLHGEFMRAFHAHWMGPISTVIIIYRIIELFINTFTKENITSLILRRNHG